MRRRVLGAVAAIALAGVGTFLVLSYIQGADERALAGEEVVEVLVVAEPVAAGADAGDLGAKVRTELVPVKVAAVGRVASLDELEGTVAAVDLLPGEQVVAARFVTPEQLEEQRDVEVPEGLLEVTVSLSPDRAVGGNLAAGDLVAFVASFEPFDLVGVEPSDLTFEELVALEALYVDQVQQPQPQESFETLDIDVPDFDLYKSLETPNSSHVILHKVLVTNVQVERLPEATAREDAEESGVALAPTGNLLVTLALEAPDVEKVVFTAEHGTVWLAHEPEDAEEEGTQVQTRGSIYLDGEAETRVTP